MRAWTVYEVGEGVYGSPGRSRETGPSNIHEVVEQCDGIPGGPEMVSGNGIR